MPILHHFADQGNFRYPTYEPPNVPPYSYPYIPYPYPYTHYPNPSNQSNQGGHYRLGGDDYFTSAMLDFGGSSSGNVVGGSSRRAGFDDDDMDDSFTYIEDNAKLKCRRGKAIRKKKENWPGSKLTFLAGSELEMGTFQETLSEGNEGALHLGPEHARVYSDLSPEDKYRYNADVWATNILLQGLPKDIYTLINHYTDAKDIWDNVKMLLEDSELTKEDRESQLYDDFEHFCQNKGETIHYYYGRFVTAVKLNRGLRDSNYDQLYAYLKQHEAHANKNKMMLE
ncbi:hypothetical protein Tco_0516257 [Tanacetum coccineum]